MKRVILFALGGILFTIGESKRHKCKYELCPYKDQTTYKHAHTGAPGEVTDDEGSDCDALDWVHFNNPSLTYDECEDFLFNNYPKF